MVFDRNGMQARHGDAGFDGERHGEGEWGWALIVYQRKIKRHGPWWIP
jgi:hypothetical protein